MPAAVQTYTESRKETGHNERITRHYTRARGPGGIVGGRGKRVRVAGNLAGGRNRGPHVGAPGRAAG